MDALASIALAAAKLDADEGDASLILSLSQGKRGKLGEPRAEAENFAHPLAGVTTPPRVPKQSFLAPRVVSVGSTMSLDTPERKGSKSSSSGSDIETAVSDPIPPPPPPSEVIKQVKENDVLCGRGGETNHHPGNVRYRGYVKKYQRVYLSAKRRDKPKIARKIVDEVRRRNGRFLKKDPASNTWRDVGNNKAREKTSQALREGAPDLRTEDPSSGEDNFEERSLRQSHVVPTDESLKLEKRKRVSQTSSVMQITDATLVSPTPSPSGSLQDRFSSPSVTISADDDDSRSDDQSNDGEYHRKKKQSFRGPRLAILKKRLMQDEC